MVAVLALALRGNAHADPSEKVYFKYNGQTAAALDKTGNLYSKSGETVFGGQSAMTGLLIKRNGTPLYAIREPNANNPQQFGTFATANYFVVEFISSLPLPGETGVLVAKYQGSGRMEFDHLDASGGAAYIKNKYIRMFQIRRDGLNLTAGEKKSFVDAVVHLNQIKYPGTACEARINGNDMMGHPISYVAAGGVTHFAKYDEIHGNTMVHGSPNAWIWHRELMNRFEAELQAYDPVVSLPFWDWSEPDSALAMMTTDFMGSASGVIGTPWTSLYGGCNDACVTNRVDPCTTNSFCTSANACRDTPLPTQFCCADTDCAGHEACMGASGSCTAAAPDGMCMDSWRVRWNAAFPPKDITRSVGGGVVRDAETQAQWVSCPKFADWHDFRYAVELAHGDAHTSIGGNTGTISNLGTAARDPMFFLLHSGVDRLIASWQQAHAPVTLTSQMYGTENGTNGYDMGNYGVTIGLEPWADVIPGFTDSRAWSFRHVRPWTNVCCTTDGATPRPQVKTSVDTTLVTPPVYESYVGSPSSCPCSTTYDQANCYGMGVGTIVSAVGQDGQSHDWKCIDANCSRCSQYGSCAPGASGCPFGTLWQELGVCTP